MTFPSYGPPSTAVLSTNTITIPDGCRNVGVDTTGAPSPPTITTVNPSTDMADGDVVSIFLATSSGPLYLAPGGNVKGLNSLTFQFGSPNRALALKYRAATSDFVVDSLGTLTSTT